MGERERERDREKERERGGSRELRKVNNEKKSAKKLLRRFIAV